MAARRRSGAAKRSSASLRCSGRKYKVIERADRQGHEGQETTPLIAECDSLWLWHRVLTYTLR
jgi:hypothetical protein